MKILIAAAFVALAALSGADTAFAQEPARLARPLPESRMGEDGRMIVAEGYTFGNLAVDQYTRYAGHFFAPGADPRMMANAARPMMCDTGAIGGLTRTQLSRLIPEIDRETRARLRARDEASLTDLAIQVIAAFDRVDAEAIRADEAIGPGVYHDAIRALAISFDACDFYGLERRL